MDPSLTITVAMPDWPLGVPERPSHGNLSLGRTLLSGLFSFEARREIMAVARSATRGRGMLINDGLSDHQPSVAWVDSIRGLTRAAFALFLVSLMALLIALYAGVPIPDSWPG